jgi:hypothetical protein
VTIFGSLLVAVIITVLQKYEFLPFYVTALLTPAIAFGICFVLTLMIQQITCGKVNPGPAALGTLGVATSTGVATLILTLEDLPLLTFIEPLTGPFVPVNPVTGTPYDTSSIEYATAMENQNHKKIQVFSNIVKKALPVGFLDSTKSAIATFYWMFWLTMLPFYFTLSLQASCPT